MLPLSLAALAYHLVHLQAHAAKTVVAHDFSPLLAPEPGGFFVGVVRHEEIKAIGNCRRDRAGGVRLAAVAPEEYEAAVRMIELLGDAKTLADWDALAAQPRWYVEELYLLDDAPPDDA